MHPQPHDLTALAYGLISGPERQQMLEHLATCEDCRAEYDAAFDEQSVLRQALVAEVRSGESEARALDRTLNAIALQPALESDVEGVSRPVGRLFTLPRSVRYAIEAAAAVIVIAVGVFYMVQPGSPLNPAPATNTVARGTPEAPAKGPAPAKLEGVVFASDADGNKWERAGEVTADCWLRSDVLQPATLSFESGLVCTFSTDAEFKLVSSGEATPTYTIFLRSGDAQLNALGVTSAVPIETSNNDVFFAMPGSSMKVSLRRTPVRVIEGNPPVINTCATAQKGSVVWVYQTGKDASTISMLQNGDQAELDRGSNQLFWREAKGDEVRVVFDTLSLGDEKQLLNQMAWVETQRQRLSAAPQVGEIVQTYRWETKVGDNARRILDDMRAVRDAENLHFETWAFDPNGFQKYLPEGDLPGNGVEKIERYLPDGEYTGGQSEGMTVMLVVKTVGDAKTFTMRLTGKDGKVHDAQGKTLQEASQKLMELLTIEKLPGLPVPTESQKREQSQARPNFPGLPGERGVSRVIRVKAESSSSSGGSSSSSSSSSSSQSSSSNKQGESKDAPPRVKEGESKLVPPPSQR